MTFLGSLPVIKVEHHFFVWQIDANFQTCPVFPHPLEPKKLILLNPGSFFNRSSSDSGFDPISPNITKICRKLNENRQED